MFNKKKFIIALIMGLLLYFAYQGFIYIYAMYSFSQIAESHIDGNVPDSSELDEFLKRDITAYFKSVTGEDVAVEYELLREGPTQTGVAYPKYYLWVRINANNKLVDQGAVRVAAIDKNYFDITDFLSFKEIKENPEKIYSVFPEQVCTKIKEKVK